MYFLVKLSESERLSREERKFATINRSKPKESKFFTTGEKFRNFNFKDLEGNRFKLKDLVGKVVVLNYWFINCPPCRKEIPELNTLVEKYKDNHDVVFIAIEVC